MNDLKKVKVTCCEGGSQGSCKRCVDKDIWNRIMEKFKRVQVRIDKLITLVL